MAVADGMQRSLRIPWSAQDVAELSRRYPHEQTKVIAADLGRPIHTVYQKANGMGLKKDEDYLESDASGRLNGRDTRGLSSRFTKGAVPFNKGTHFHAGGRSVETQFKKGQMSGAAARNYVPIGSERISKDGYLERKVTDDHPVPTRRWTGVHRIVWEAAHGPIPSGHIVVFKRGMRTQIADEITADKLELITRVENMRRNSYRNYPQPIPQLIQLRGALNRKINKRERKKA